MMDNISRLSQWYADQCVDEWEEEFGITIRTLDNPGWELKIDLNKTPLAKRAFSEIKIEVTDKDWLVARKVGFTFEAFGGPLNLDQMIAVFLKWEKLPA